jgi:hypothetical protein
MAETRNLTRPGRLKEAHCPDEDKRSPVLCQAEAFGLRQSFLSGRSIPMFIPHPGTVGREGSCGELHFLK